MASRSHNERPARRSGYLSGPIRAASGVRMSLDWSAALDFSAQLRRTAAQVVQWQYEAILKGPTQQFEFLDEDDRFDASITWRPGTGCQV